MATNVGEPRETHLRNVCELIKTQEEKAKQYSTPNALRPRPGKPLSKGPISSYQRKDSKKIDEDLVSLWEQVKNDSPAYQRIERSRASSKPEVGGSILKCHLRKYWASGSPDTYKAVPYSLRKLGLRPRGRAWQLGLRPRSTCVAARPTA